LFLSKQGLQNIYISHIVGPNVIAMNARMWTLLIKWKEG
jgi:hypothetical protein